LAGNRGSEGVSRGEGDDEGVGEGTANEGRFQRLGAVGILVLESIFSSCLVLHIYWFIQPRRVFLIPNSKQQGRMTSKVRLWPEELPEMIV